MSFPLQPVPPRRMPFDAAAFLRVDALQSVGTSASGAEFATSTGDIFEVTCFGPGVFRLRAGPRTKPDYGLVAARAKACAVARSAGGLWTFTAGETTLELSGAPLSVRLLHRGVPVAGSITDEHFGGAARLPSLGRLRNGGQWLATFALASGEPVYGLGEKFGPLNKRGQLIHSQVTDALGVNTGQSYKSTPFAWSPGLGKGAWGIFVNTPSMVTHGVGHPDWSHRSYAVQVDDEALELFLLAAETPAGILDLYTQLTGRPAPVPAWSLGLWVSRAYYKTPAEAADVAAKLRQRKIPCDVLTLDGRAAWDVGTRFDFTWDPARFPDPRAALSAIKAHNLRICAWEYPYVSVHSPLFVELASRNYLLTTADGDPYVFGWDTTPETSPFANAQTPLPESGIVDFTHPGAYVWWRDAHAPLFADGVDVIKSDFGEHVPDDAVAFNGDTGRRLHNVYPLLYNQCVRDATEKFQRNADAPPMVWGRAGWTGSQRCPIQWGGEPQSDWEGLAASLRGGLSWGMSGVPYHSTDIGGFYGSEPPSPELYVRWLQAAVFASHIGVPRRRRARAVGVRRRCRGGRAQVARVPLPADSLPAGGDRRRGRHGDARDARDGARVSGQRAHPRVRNAVHVRRHAARRAHRPRRGRSGGRAAAGRVVRPQFAPALSRASACSATRPRSTSFRCSAAKGSRCRSVAPSSTPARSTPRIRWSSSGSSAGRRGRSTDFSRRRSRPAPTARTRSAPRPTSRSSASATRPASMSVFWVPS